MNKVEKNPMNKVKFGADFDPSSKEAFIQAKYHIRSEVQLLLRSLKKENVNMIIAHNIL